MVLVRHLSVPILPLLIAAGVLLICAAALSKVRIWLLFALFLVLGGLRFDSMSLQESPLAALLKSKTGIRQELSFRVLQTLSSSNNNYAVRMENLAGQPLRDVLIFSSIKPMIPGERYRSMADISPLTSDPILQIYPSRYSAIAYQLGGAKRLQPSLMRYLPARLRNNMLQNLDAKLGADAGWAKGLLLSDPTSKKAFNTELSQSGIMHLIVVSGLHVWFIYLVLVSLLRIFVRRHIAEMIFLPLILLFAALNNWAPPITRSIIMIAVGLIARWLQRPLSGAQSLSLSLFIITLINPAQLFNIGLQLSFICMAVVLFGVPRLYLFNPDTLMQHHLRRFLQHLFDGLILSLLVSLAITPLTLYYFGRASFNGVIANILGIPLIGILLPLSLLILLLPPGLYLSHIFVLSYNALVQLWQKLVVQGAQMPFSFNGAYFNRNHALALALLILMAFLFIRGKYKLGLVLALPSLMLAGSLYFLPLNKANTADVHVFSCGVADCSLVRLASGETIMIDTGGGRGFTMSDTAPSEEALLHDSWLQNTLLPWLGRNGIRKLDYLVLTHLHADHFGGLLSLLQGMKVEHLIISDDTARQPLWQFFASRPYFKPRYVHTITDTISIPLEKGRLKFLHPDKDFFSNNENERSLVCRLDSGGQKILFTGDIGVISEEYLARKYPQELACDYLKIPHHGSRGSSTDAFLRLAKPGEAWLSTSFRNRFGFPHPETVQRYRYAQIPVRSTMEGSIRTRLLQKD